MSIKRRLSEAVDELIEKKSCLSRWNYDRESTSNYGLSCIEDKTTSQELSSADSIQLDEH